MMKGQYHFYGWKTADVSPVEARVRDKVKDPRRLYDLLLTCWSRETCAPRLREGWTEENPTLGQCSITAFLVQDLFGGKVFGIKRPDGNYHCYNDVNGCVFDLTSEQFGPEASDLVYVDNPEQKREVHFRKQEKYERYLLLKEKLLHILEGQADV